MEKKISLTRRRDVIMKWKNRCNLAVLAVESQEKIHYAMPVRNMIYDGLAYSDQMKVIWNNIPKDERPRMFSDEFFSRLRKEDKLYPVITLVIYFGESGDWDGSLYLYDMFEDFIANEDKKELEKFVTNYKVNLVQLDKIEDINIFKSDLRETIGMLQCKSDEEKMKRYIEENEKALSMLDLEASRVIEDVLKIGSLKKYASKKDGRIVVNVCKAFKDHEKSGEIKGDRKRLIDLIVKKIKKDKSIDVIAEELETDKIEIESFYNIAVNSAPNYDVDEIYEKWKVNNNY